MWWKGGTGPGKMEGKKTLAWRSAEWRVRLYSKGTGKDYKIMYILKKIQLKFVDELRASGTYM